MWQAPPGGSRQKEEGGGGRVTRSCRRLLSDRPWRGEDTSPSRRPLIGTLITQGPRGTARRMEMERCDSLPPPPLPLSVCRSS